MLGHSMWGARGTSWGALAGHARVVPCPQADGPLLLRLEDMSSRLRGYFNQAEGLRWPGERAAGGDRDRTRERREEKPIYAGM